MTRKDIRKLDGWVFPQVRARGKCDRCNGRKWLQTSHIYSRRYLSIRWHPFNLNCFDASCHWWYGQNPIDGVEWVKTWLGEKKFAELKRLRNQLGKSLTVEEVKSWWE